jgi:hypothetical protein
MYIRPLVLAVRAVLLVLAVAVIGWTATQLAALNAQERLTEIAFRPVGNPTPDELRAAADLVRTGERLNADRMPSLLRGVIVLRSGDAAGAADQFAAITRDEPENLPAWALLARAAGEKGDEALAERARARQAELAPPVPPAPR